MWELVARSLEASTIFLFAALGELIDQRSGVLNVGLEGLMLFGGTAAFITGLGLAIRCAGENPAAAEASGIPVTSIRFLCVALGGMLAGLSGATYTLSYNPVWNYNFLMGWGFVSLALVFFSMWNPWILLAGASLFGIMWQLSLSPELVLPGVLSRYVWRTVPFAITIPILCVISTSWFRTRWGLGKPEALGRPYAKE